MTTQLAPTASPKWARRPWLFYAIAVVVMIVCWTLVRYADQPYRSPTYRRGLVECLGYAAWSAPMEGAGPLVPITLRVISPPPDYDGFAWKAPAFGAVVFLSLVALLSRVGKKWSPIAHLSIGAGWLLVGAIILTRMTMK